MIDYSSQDSLDGSCCDTTNDIVARIIADDKKAVLLCAATVQDIATGKPNFPLTVVAVGGPPKIKIAKEGL